MRDLKWFFLLSRPLNLLIAAAVYGYCVLLLVWREDASWDALMQEPVFHSSAFWGSMLALVLVMAGGYWVNDVFDFKIDRINKPSKVIVNSYLSSKKTLTAYFVSQTLVLLASFWYLPPLLAFFILNAAVMLFIYAALLKRISVAGNLIISTLTAMVVMMAGALTNRVNMPLIWLCIFAFEITFLRELTKDIEDIRGDLRYKLRTLPIQAGMRAAKTVLLVAGCIFIFSCWFPVFEDLLRQRELNAYYLLSSFFFVQAPTAGVLFLIQKGVKPQDFHLPGVILKALILSGMLSVAFLG